LAVGDVAVGAGVVVWVALYALAFPANAASIAETAIPVSNDFVMVGHSFRCNAAIAVVRVDAASQLLHPR
jgi:hypothetical protein